MEGSLNGETKPLAPGSAAAVWQEKNNEYSKLGRRISISFALIFLFGFNGALVIAAFLNWKAPCDQPLKGFLVSLGSTGIIVSLLYFGLEFFVNKKAMNKKAKFVDMPKFVLVLMMLSGAISGILGVVYYQRSPTCNLTAPILYKWSFAAILAFLILSALILLVPLLRALLPLFGKFIGGFAAHLVAFADFCEGIGLSGRGGDMDMDGDGGMGGGRGGAGAAMSIFALYINSTALAWFFAYFIVEVYRSWDAACDTPLKIFILGFGIFGLTITLLDFFYDVFKDPRAKPSSGARKRRVQLYLLIIVVLLVWGIIGWNWVQATTTCADTAPQIYRLAVLLTMAFFVFIILLGSVGCLVGLDFCCSGRMRMVVVFEEAY